MSYRSFSYGSNGSNGPNDPKKVFGLACLGKPATIDVRRWTLDRKTKCLKSESAAY